MMDGLVDGWMGGGTACQDDDENGENLEKYRGEIAVRAAENL